MAVVRVLPASSESAVDEKHDKRDLRGQVVSLMMRKSDSQIQEYCVGGDSQYTPMRRGLNGLHPDVQRQRGRLEQSVQIYVVGIPAIRLDGMLSNSCQCSMCHEGGGKVLDVRFQESKEATGLIRGFWERVWANE